MVKDQEGCPLCEAHVQLPEELIDWILWASRQPVVQKVSTTPWLFFSSTIFDSENIAAHMAHGWGVLFFCRSKSMHW